MLKEQQLEIQFKRLEAAWIYDSRQIERKSSAMVFLRNERGANAVSVVFSRPSILPSTCLQDYQKLRFGTRNYSMCKLLRCRTAANTLVNSILSAPSQQPMKRVKTKLHALPTRLKQRNVKLTSMTHIREAQQRKGKRIRILGRVMGRVANGCDFDTPKDCTLGYEDGCGMLS
jgi:hypothetical protein